MTSNTIKDRQDFYATFELKTNSQNDTSKEHESTKTEDVSDDKSKSSHRKSSFASRRRASQLSRRKSTYSNNRKSVELVLDTTSMEKEDASKTESDLEKKNNDEGEIDMP